MTSDDPTIQEVISRIHATMKAGGITISRLAADIGVTRQYLWQVVHRRVHLSLHRAESIERSLNRLAAERGHERTFGGRLRAARRSAGFTLKEVAAMIGYSWAGVERWEKDVCKPKPGVLWHLMSIYNSSMARLEEPVHIRSLEPASAPGAYARHGGAVIGELDIPLHTRIQAHSPGVVHGITPGALAGLPETHRKVTSGIRRQRRPV
jgi:transcriptional regulator with XRE-family HTH domain